MEKPIISRPKSALAKCVMSILISFALLVLALVSYAWFINKGDTQTSQAAVKATELPELQVAKTQGGVDIEQLEEDEGKLVMAVDGGGEVVPGSSGSFDVYLTYNRTGTVSMTCEVLPYAIEGEQSPFRDGTSQQLRDLALNYLDGHIMCFLAYDSGVYSNWMAPNSGVDIALAAGVQTKVTVYWVWLRAYNAISNKLIAQSDYENVMAYVTANPQNFFYSHGKVADLTTLDYAQKCKFYDYADESIGSAIMHLCIDISCSNYR